MENHLMDIPTKSIPHMSPDGASSDGSLELKGATSYEVDDLYKRLFTIIGFPGKAVYFNHASFSDMERPVVLPLCQYLEHMENVCKELMEFLSAPDCALKKSRKRQSENILQDHYQSDKIIHDLRPRRNSSSEKPVTFKSEVASATRKHSPSQTLEKDDDDCYCKEEVEKEAIALARAMEISSQDPPKPFVPGLTPMDQEEVITVQIQPDDGKVDSVDHNGSPPMLYYENMHWVKGPLLGRGAFSICYQARDIKTDTIFALKQIKCPDSKSEQDTVIENVTKEIRIMAKLSHPNIIRIMGATRQGCHFNMFVELMPGGSVSDRLGKHGDFSEDVITSYSLQTLRGMAYLHDCHILHRDLKGDNLLIDSTGERLRIGDFGSAARLASKATEAGEFQGQFAGTIAFMAPEVIKGEDYGRACDVWSLGCCMIEMATTEPPWNANDTCNRFALMYKIGISDSTPPIPDNLSPPLRDVLLRCLERSKEQRPSAKELLTHPLFTQYRKMK